MKTAIRILSLLLLLPLVLPLAAEAGELYKWVDEDGKVHFTDKKPNADAEAIEIRDDNRFTHEAVPDDAFYERPERERSPRVVMYATEWCGYCRRAREYFQANNIRFREYDVEKSARAQRRFKRLGGTGYPLIVVGDKQMQGFNPKRFQRLYEQR